MLMIHGNTPQHTVYEEHTHSSITQVLYSNVTYTYIMNNEQHNITYIYYSIYFMPSDIRYAKFTFTYMYFILIRRSILRGR